MTNECSHIQESNKADKKAMSFAFWLNLIFSIVEIIGGILTNSTAIITDAFHDFMDAGAIGIAILMEKIANKKPSSSFSFGYRRFSLLSSIGLSLFLLIGAIIMIYNAYFSFYQEKEVKSIGMLGLAVVGIIINGIAFTKVQHSHSHSHSHNSKSIMLHLLEDVLGWVAILIGAVIIYFTGWNWIDGVLAIIIALYIGCNAIMSLVQTFKVVLQSVPDNVDLKAMKHAISQIEGVVNSHDLHVWSLDGNFNIGSIHIVIDKSISNSQTIMNTVIEVMNKHNINHPTVQIETKNSDCQVVN